MAKNILEIVFRTIKQGTGDRETQQALKDLEKNFKSVMSVGTAVTGALMAVGAVLAKGYNEWQAYSAQVRDLALASGTTATEASKLLQVLDDYQISADQVTAATKALTKQGLAPTIDTLATLSDQYHGLNSAQERNAFVLKNLGKAGMDYVNVLNQGGDAIRKMADEVNRNLILSDAQVKQAEEARLAVDALADAWQGIKIQVGAAVGEMIIATDRHKDSLEEINQFLRTTYTEDWLAAGTAGTETVQAMVIQLERGAAMTEFYTRQVEGNTIAQEENAEALKEASEANKSMLSLIGQIQSEYEGYTEKSETLRLKLEELNAAQDKVPEWSSKYKDYQTQIEATEDEIRKLADEHEMAGKRIAFSLLQQKLASDGFTDIEFNNLLQLGESWGIYDKKVVESALLMDKNMSDMAKSMDDPWFQLMNINQELGQMIKRSGMSFDYFVNIYTSGSFPSLPGNGLGEHRTVTSADYVAMASGGYLSNGWTLTGEAGPELISPSGYVFPSEATRHLLGSGMLGDVAQMAGGGSIMLDGVTNITPTNAVNYGFTPHNKPSNSSGGSSVPGSVVNSEISQASQAAAAILPMAEATQQAAQASASVQQATAMQTQQLVTAMTISQGEMTNLQRETNRLLAEQSKTLPRELTAAMIQANP